MDVLEIFKFKDQGEEMFVGGSVTNEWIVECLEKNDHKFTQYREDDKILRIDAYDISDGKGFLSKVYKVSIHLDNHKKDPYIIIVKIPGEESIRESFDKQKINIQKTDDKTLSHITRFHNVECTFYIYIAPLIRGLKYPKCYGAQAYEIGKKDGAVIMQYLGSNSKTIPFYVGLNVSQTVSVLEEVYKLHKYSLINPNDQWKGRFEPPYQQKTFKKIEGYIKNTWGKTKKYMSSEMIKEIEDDVLILMDNYAVIASEAYDEIEPCDNNQGVLTHGDMWINNFMFKTDINGNCTNELRAIIDWQTVHEGSIGLDIARVLIVSAPPDVRRELEKNYLPDHYKRLTSTLRREKKPFKISYDGFMYNYKICMVEQSLMLIMMIGFALQEFNIPEKEDYVWDARKFNIGARIYFALFDSIKICQELKPEWLKKIN
uniref:CHK domain-containing protein n=1 Tax=Parastrongyloides trichosuri TaxID=131310 RepID=A0A0N4ZZF0_PARTI